MTITQPAPVRGEEAGVARPSRGRRLFAHIAVFAALCILLALGTWQVERLQDKEALIARIEARIGAPPEPIAAVARRFAETRDVDFVPTEARGRFLHAGERHFLSTFEGEAGWNVYTPFVLADGGGIVFVNRGFVPYARRDPATRPAGQVEGEVAVVGLARNAPADKGNWLLPDNDPASNTFFWPNIADMARGLDLPAGVPLMPFLLAKGEGAPPPGGLPVGGTTVLAIPNNHLQYAITWYGLALVLAVMYGAFLLRGRGADAGAAPPGSGPAPPSA